MSIIQKSNKDLAVQALNSFSSVREKMRFCCNVGMETRDEEIKKMDLASKMLLLIARKEELREAIWSGKEYVVYFDMDGITHNWRKEILKEYPQFKNIDELNKHPDKDKLVRAVYDKYPDFFRDLEPMNRGLDMAVRLIGNGINVKFLTAVDPVGESRSIRRGKRESLTMALKERGVSKLPDIIYTEDSAGKKFYAEPQAILVDDYLVNIKEWQAAGGYAIHVDTEEKDEYEAWRIGEVLLQVLVDETRRFRLACKSFGKDY
ncbi:putative DNA repair exonuclease [Vibrio phage C-ZP2022]|nr:putative DNA repair exonuclease [Vibrio phage C-ZP2022]